MKIIRYITAFLSIGLFFSCSAQDGFQEYHLDNLKSICLPTESIILANKSDVEPTNFSDILISLKFVESNVSKNRPKELDINIQSKSSTNKDGLYHELLEGIQTKKIQPTFNSELNLHVVPSTNSVFGWHYIEKLDGSISAELKIDDRTYVAFCPDVVVNGSCFVTQVVDTISFRYQLDESQMQYWKELSTDLESKFTSWLSCKTDLGSGSRGQALDNGTQKDTHSDKL